MPSFEATITTITQRNATGVAMANRRDQNSRRAGTAASVLSICACGCERPLVFGGTTRDLDLVEGAFLLDTC